MLNKFKRFFRKAIEPVMNEGGFIDPVTVGIASGEVGDMFDTPDAPDYPAMSPEETFFLALASGQLTGDLSDIEAMNPLIWEQMGIEKVPVERSPEDMAKIQGIQDEIDFWTFAMYNPDLSPNVKEQLATSFIPSLRNKMEIAKQELGPDYTFKKLPLTPEQQEAQEAKETEQREVDEINDEIRDLTLKSLRGELPGQEATKEINRLTQERTLAALKGELPISPALERDISEGEKNIEASLSQRLGPNWMLSTPGVQTKGKFNETALLARDAARRGDLAQSFPMLLQGQGLSQSYTNANMPLLTSGTNLGLGLSSFAAGENQRLLSNLSGYPTIGSGLYGVYPSLMQPYQMQREGQFQSGMAQYGADVSGQNAFMQGLFGLGGVGLYGFLTGGKGGKGGK